MADRYRFTLGMSRVGDNLLQGHSPVVIHNFPTGVHAYQGVIKPGYFYELIFEQTGSTTAGLNGNAFGVGVGYGSIAASDFYPTKGYASRYYPDANGLYTYRNICLEGEDFFWIGYDSRSLQNEELYKLDWNDPLNTIPVGWDEAKLELKRDDVDFAQIERYSTTLNFVDDGYRYLLEILHREGNGGIVPVKIEKLKDWCSPYATDLIYEDIFIGDIYLNKVVWNEPERTAAVVIEQSSAGTALANGKTIKVELFGLEHKYCNNFFTAPGYNWATELHDASGTYPNYIWPSFLPVIDILKGIARVMSDGKVDVRSDYFTDTYPYLMLTNGYLLWHPFVVDSGEIPSFEMSFEEAFNNLDKVHNLGIGFEFEGNIPIIRVEPKQYFSATTSEPVVLDKVRKITISAPKEIDFRVLDIGYKNKWNPDELTAEDLGDIQHYSSGNIANATRLDLVTDWIADGNYILYAISQAAFGGAPVGGETADIDDKIIMVECELDVVVAFIKTVKSTQVTPAEYNHTLHPKDNFERWKPSLPEDIFGGYKNDTSGTRNYGSEFRNKIIKFQRPLSMADFNLLVNPEQRVQVSGADIGGFLEGLVMSCSRSMKTGIAEFEVLTE